VKWLMPSWQWEQLLFFLRCFSISSKFITEVHTNINWLSLRIYQLSQKCPTISGNQTTKIHTLPLRLFNLIQLCNKPQVGLNATYTKVKIKTLSVYVVTLPGNSKQGKLKVKQSSKTFRYLSHTLQFFMRSMQPQLHMGKKLRQ